MSFNERMSEMRALLYDDPTPERWARICDLLDQWPAEDSPEVAIDNAEQVLKSWPVEMCVAPDGWATAFIAKKSKPHHTIARALDLSGRKLKASTVTTLLGRPSIAQFSALRLDNNPIGPPYANFGLQTSPHLAGLTHLSLQNVKFGSTGAALFGKIDSLPNLVSLDLSKNNIGVKGFQGLGKADFPHLRRLAVGRNKLAGRGLAALLKAPFAPQITHLDVSEAKLEGKDLLAISMSPMAESLQALDLSRNAFTVGLKVLSAPKAFPALTTLHLSGVILDAKRAKQLAASTLFGQLDTLSLDGTRIDPESLQTVLSRGGPEGFKHLNLSQLKLSMKAAAFLGSTPATSGLLTLNIAECRLSNEAWVTWAKEQHFGALETLVVSDCAITKEVAGFLATCTRLRKLDIKSCQIRQEAAEAIAALPSLTHLTIDKSKITSDGFATIVGSEAMSKLAHLSARECWLEPLAANALARSNHMKQLRVLDLSFNSMGDVGAKALANTGNLPALRKLDMGYNRLTNAGGKLIHASTHLHKQIRSAWSDYDIKREGWFYNRYDSSYE